MKYFFVVTFLLVSWIASGQPNIIVEVSADTIALGETVEIKYFIQNGDGQLKLPSLDSLPVISGPNTTSSFALRNGEQKNSQSFSFVLLGVEEGKLTVPKAVYLSRNEELDIEPVEIVVVASFDNTNDPSEKTKKETTKTKREKRVF